MISHPVILDEVLTHFLHNERPVYGHVMSTLITSNNVTDFVKTWSRHCRLFLFQYLVIYIFIKTLSASFRAENNIKILNT